MHVACACAPWLLRGDRPRECGVRVACACGMCMCTMATAGRSASRMRGACSMCMWHVACACGMCMCLEDVGCALADALGMFLCIDHAASTRSHSCSQVCARRRHRRLVAVHLGGRTPGGRPGVDDGLHVCGPDHHVWLPRRRDPRVEACRLYAHPRSCPGDGCRRRHRINPQSLQLDQRVRMHVHVHAHTCMQPTPNPLRPINE